MNFTANIDISTFIWSQEDFNTNKPSYYKLIELAPTVYEQIKEKKIPVLLRDELYYLLMAEFPYISINDISRDYGTLTQLFLKDVNWFPYEDEEISNVSTIPNIIKDHFSEEIKKECGNQIVHLFNNNISKDKFVAYHYFFDHKNKLNVNSKTKSVEIDTLSYQSEDEIIQFFENLKIKFRHNPKHNKYKSGGNISPLSCYNERDEDINRAQRLLDTAHPVNNDFYNYDAENGVYVIFVTSNDGTFHGFDLSDEENNVPYEVKKTFNKNGRKF